MKYILCLVGCLLLTACGGETNDEAGQVREMVYAVTNRTGELADDVVLYGKGLGANVSYSEIAEGDTKILTRSDLKLPQNMHVDWTDAKGKRVYQQVNLWKALGEKYTGKVHLTLEAGPAVSISK